MDFKTMDTIEAAKELLGKKLVIDHGEIRLSGYIVETEAYLGPEDRAAHGYEMRRSPKVEALYKEGGALYVHVIHGHMQLNIVTGPEDSPQGVLIRGIEPLEGIEFMQQRRGREGIEITNGPGKLTQAFGIDKKLYGIQIGEGNLWIDYEHSKTPKEIGVSARIGIPNKGEWTEAPLRFYVMGNPYVSRMRKREMLSSAATWQIT